MSPAASLLNASWAAWITIAIQCSGAVVAAPPPADSSAIPIDQTTQSVDVFEDAQTLFGGNIRVGVTNYGITGYQAAPPAPFPLRDEQYPSSSGNSSFLEFPAGSNRGHLYAAGLWVGGLRAGDSIVSLALTSQSSTGREFSTSHAISHASNLIQSPFFDITSQSQDRFSLDYVDTVQLSTTGHSPLGIAVTQETHAWLSPPYEDIVVQKFTIKNVSLDCIESTYVGMIVDADVNYLLNRDVSSGAIDDLSGYLPAHALAYTIDNDGDPAATGTWGPASVRSGVGVVPLEVSPAPACTTFNWWVINGVRPPIDFGRTMSPDPPVGDRESYYAMAHPFKDFDQIQTYVEYHSRWPYVSGAYLRDIADGLDTRYLLSFGPYDLKPDSIVKFTVAFVVAPDIHQAPTDFHLHWDPEHPEGFYARLDFSKLIEKAQLARELWSEGLGGRRAAPPLVRAWSLSDTSVMVSWSETPGLHPASYRVFRRSIMEPSEWGLIGEVAAPKRDLRDYPPESGAAYEYSITSVSSQGIESAKSWPVSVIVGQPESIPEISAASGKHAVHINWSLRPAEHEPVAWKALRMYRQAPGEATPSLIATIPLREALESTKDQRSTRGVTSANVRDPRILESPARLHGEHWDSTAESGVLYTYFATVVNDYGYESVPSEEVEAFAMAMDRGGLALTWYFVSDIRPNPLLRLAESFKFYSDWARKCSFDTLRQSESPPTTLPQDSLRRILSHYRRVVFTCEDGSEGRPAPRLALALEEYIVSGGEVIFVGRSVPFRVSSTTGRSHFEAWTAEFGPDAFANEVLGVYRTSMEGPAELLTHWAFVDTMYTEFATARSTDAFFPMIDADSLAAFNVNPFGNEFPTRIGDGRLPAVGAMDSVHNVEVLYTFGAAHPDTSHFEGLPVAIGRRDPGARFVLINFPLSLMDPEVAPSVLDAAMRWLDLATPPELTTAEMRDPFIAALLSYLRTAEGECLPGWDANNDGAVDYKDLVELIDTR